MKTDQWSAAASELQADRRAELGDRIPELETLQAFFRDELPEDEADVVREFLVLYPEVAAALMADESAPPVPGPGHPAHLSAAEREAGWRDLAARLDIPGEPITPPRAAPRWHTLWAVAATLAFGALLVPQFLPPKPEVIEVRELELDLTRGSAGAPSPLQILGNEKKLLVKLSLPPAGRLKQFRVELLAERDGDTQLLWHEEKVATDGSGTLHVVLPARRVPPGIYQLRLFLEGVSSQKPTWEFRFETF
ncbi:MAG: hypothetical protein SF066_14475 [Thermoanaerobaculia bacterium]|nr:hypothetical protein [Thermoanaerobaculia bacterium]